MTDDRAIDENDRISCQVRVTNTGERAGKEVVQLYYSPPYYPETEGSGIQKAGVVLGIMPRQGNLNQENRKFWNWIWQ